MKCLAFWGCLLALAAGAAEVWQVSDVSMKSRAPWENLVDIDFTLTAPDGAAADAVARLEVFASNGVERVRCSSAHASTFYFGAGRQRLRWNPTADNPGRSFGHLTVALGVADADAADEVWYMTVRLNDGHLDYYGKGFADSVNQNVYKREYMAFRRCPATTSDEWKGISGGNDYFVMGSSDPNDGIMKTRNADAVHVRLTHDFWLGVFPVTWGQWKALGFAKPTTTDVTKSQSCLSNDYNAAMGIYYGQIRGDDSGDYCFPAKRGVDPASYMGILRQRTGRDFDLPTEAQLEYATRAGTTGKWYWSANGQYLNPTLPQPYQTWEVGHSYRTPPNAWGFYDIVDALHQWTTTLGRNEADTAYYAHVAGDDPEGETPTWAKPKRIIHGTHCFGDSNYGQAAYRMGQTSRGEAPSELRFDGFRVCLTR